MSHELHDGHRISRRLGLTASIWSNGSGAEAVCIPTPMS